MSLLQNKPYVWVDNKNSGNPIIKFIYDTGDYPGFTSNVPYESGNEDTRFCDFYITDDEEIAVRDNPMVFMPTVQTPPLEKVTVRIFGPDNQLLGFHTVKPEQGNFNIEGEEPPAIPYIYLKFINTGLLKVKVATEFKIGVRFDEELTEETEIILSFDNYTATKKLFYYLDPEVEPGVDFQTIDLNKDNYDPVLEDIIVEVVVQDKNENTERKGHGTTHGSEGDASGNG